MRCHRGWGFRGALVVAVSGFCALAGAAHAQGAGAAAPGAALRQQLSDLAANPQSVDQLVATGRAALALGDGEAALGFFTRAEQLAARDARVKAGLAAANARAGRPETALTLFAEAAALGAPEAELAADRGLAYDMVGQTARAQQDYLASLRHRDDPEVRRRLALSLAISGQREAALRLIEPQLASGDRAGQRARVMVLALTGDARGASAAASAALPAQAAQSLTPFLTRLASLSPGEMAAAANLGRVPAAGGVRQAAARSQADPAALAFAGGGTSALSARLPIALADATPRRRPGGVTGTASAAASVGVGAGGVTGPAWASGGWERGRAAARDAGRPSGSWTTTSSTAAVRLPEAVSATAASAFRQPHPHEPLRVSREALEPAELAGAAPAGPRIPRAEIAGPPARSAPIAAPVQLAAAAPYQPVPDPTPAASQPEAGEEPVDGAAANLAVWNNGAAPTRVEAPVTARVETSVPVRVQANAPPRRPAAAPAAANRPGFSDVVATVSSLPAETAAARPRTTPNARRTQTTTPALRNTTATAATTRRTQTSAATTRAASPRQTNPARIWVQLGVSNNRAGFGYEMTRMRRAAAELRTQTAYTASSGSNHRLLVGPFPTDAAARTFINTLRQKDIPSLAWTSTAGTPVERLPAGR